MGWIFWKAPSAKKVYFVNYVNLSRNQTGWQCRLGKKQGKKGLQLFSTNLFWASSAAIQPRWGVTGQSWPPISLLTHIFVSRPRHSARYQVIHVVLRICFCFFFPSSASKQTHFYFLLHQPRSNFHPLKLNNNNAHPRARARAPRAHAHQNFSKIWILMSTFDLFPNFPISCPICFIFSAN